MEQESNVLTENPVLARLWDEERRYADAHALEVAEEWIMASALRRYAQETAVR